MSLCIIMHKVIANITTKIFNVIKNNGIII